MTPVGVPGLPTKRPSSCAYLFDAVAAQGEEQRARRHFALAFVQPAQEWPAAVEFAVQAAVPIIDAMVGDAAQHGVADVPSPAALDVAADRITAARIADERHAWGAGAAFQFLDGLAEFAALVLGRGLVRFRLGIVGARQGIGEIDRKHTVARNPVGFHPPHRGDPQRCMVAIAMNEKDRRNFHSARGGSRCLRKGSETEVTGYQRQGSGAFQYCPPRHAHLVTSRYFFGTLAALYDR